MSGTDLDLLFIPVYMYIIVYNVVTTAVRKLLDDVDVQRILWMWMGV